MEREIWLLTASLAVLTGFVTFALLAAMTLLAARRRALRLSSAAGLPRHLFDARTAFLFDDEVLVDATPAGRQLMSLAQRGGSGWARLMQVLRARFPLVEERLAELLDRGSVSVTSEDGRSILKAEWHDGLARLQLQDIDPGSGEGEVQVDRLALLAMQEEMDLFRDLAARFPYPTWIETAENKIEWANAAYLELAEKPPEEGAFPGWPPPRIFPDIPAGGSKRLSIETAAGKTRWFEVEHIPRPGSQLLVAVPADHLVAAETTRHEFLQTLTKTFASLSVGLAVFDRNHRLILFNPALSDLTDVTADFLAQRPSLDAYLDRLRDKRVLPEPRDFHAWKQNFLRTISSAELGFYTETWALPNGRTYELQGRRIHEGALAFVLQDVTQEMRMTRQFRADLTRHQEILDRLDTPMVVFDADGNLFAANAMYRQLWGDAAEAALPEAQAIWSGLCPEAANWEFEDEIPQERSLQGQLIDGRKLRARLIPLPGNASLIEFHQLGLAPKAVAGTRNA